MTKAAWLLVCSDIHSCRMKVSRSFRCAHKGKCKRTRARSESIFLVLIFFHLLVLDDSVRAVFAAIEICKKLRESVPDLSIGVTTGRVFCGSLGSIKRHEYAIVGDIGKIIAREKGSG